MKEARLQVPGLHLDCRAVRKRRGSRSREQPRRGQGCGWGRGDKASSRSFGVVEVSCILIVVLVMSLCSYV